MNILIFIIATIINVTLSTIRSICTIKCGKWLSAISNAICYGFYPLIVMLTAKDTVTILANMAITAIVNFVCVWIIKWVEEKAKKDKMWKVEMAIPIDNVRVSVLHCLLEPIPHNYNVIGNWIVCNCYCMHQKDTALCAEIAKIYEGKISAYENKMGVI